MFNLKIFLCLGISCFSCLAQILNVSTCAELQNINANLTSSYQLVNDINCSSLASFTPIGGLNGNFNGNYFTIMHVRINPNCSEHCGLFSGVAPGRTVSNLRLVNITSGGRSNVGILCGTCPTVYSPLPIYFRNIVIERSSLLIDETFEPDDGWSWGFGAISGYLWLGNLVNVSANVSFSTKNSTTKQAVWIGGLVGEADSGTFTNCSASLSVNTDGSLTWLNGTGGLVGLSLGDRIFNSYASLNIYSTKTPSYILGGLVGAGGGQFSQCYARANISVASGQLFGGLVGSTSGTTIENSYALGYVSGYDGVGGLIGGLQTNSSSSTISNSYTAVQLIGKSNLGGLIGLLDGPAAGVSVSNSYWSTDTTGQKTSPGGGTGLNTQQMQKKTSYTNWDFATIWNIMDGLSYPWLRNTNGTL